MSSKEQEGPWAPRILQEGKTKLLPLFQRTYKKECSRKFWKIIRVRWELRFQFSHSVMSDSLQPHGLQHTRLPCPSPTPRACSNSCPSSWWCHPTISSSITPFSSCLQSFPASGSFPMSVFHTRWPKYWSFSFSISLPMNIQDWVKIQRPSLL